MLWATPGLLIISGYRAPIVGDRHQEAPWRVGLEAHAAKQP